MPPLAKVPKMSYTDKSKDNFDTPNTVRLLFRPRRLFTLSMVFIAAEVRNDNTFGIPVLPEVKMM